MPGLDLPGPVRSVAAGILALVASAGFTACAPPERSVGDYAEYPLLRKDLDPDVAQSLMEEWVVTTSRVFQARVDEVAADVTDPELLRNLTTFTQSFLQGVRRAGWRLEPIGAAYDAWLYIRQVEEFLAGERAETTLGPVLDRLRAIVDETESHLRLALEQMVVDVELAYDEAIADWVAAHPIEDLDLVRLSPGLELASQTDGVRDAWQSVARLEFAATAAYARLNDAILSIPEDVRRQVEMVVRGIMREPLLVNALVGLARLGDGMKETAEAISTLDRGLDGHRDAILDELDRERVETLEVLRGERAAVLEAVAAERTIVLETIAAEREVVLESLSEEREAIVEAVARERRAVMESIAVEREALVEGVGERIETVTDRVDELAVRAVDRAVDRSRTVVLAAAGIVAAGLVVGLSLAGLIVRGGRRSSGGA